MLEHAGVRVVNSAMAIEHGVDKYYTSARLHDAGLPTPRTVVAERFEDAMAAYEELGGDVVVKPLFGSEGRGIVRVTDADTAYRALRALDLGRYIYCLQEFVPHGHEDIRVFVVGDRVVGAMLRRANGWKTNAAQGAKGEPFEPDDRVVDLSLRATRVVGAEHAGVDILPGRRRRVQRHRSEHHPGMACPARGHRRRRRAVPRRPRPRGAGVERLTGDEIAWAAQLACLFEASIEKPGNVSPRMSFSDMRFEDFLTSAVAIGPALRDAGPSHGGRDDRQGRGRHAPSRRRQHQPGADPAARSLGEGRRGRPRRRRPARRAGRRLEVPDRTGCGSGLRGHPWRRSRRHGRDRPPRCARARGHRDLARGHGSARERDSIAREYVTDFALTFSLGAETILRRWRDGAGFSDAVQTAFLTILAETPDTLIARKNGVAVAEDVSRRAAHVLAAGGTASVAGRAEIRRTGARARGQIARAEPRHDGRPRRGVAVRRPDRGRHARRCARPHGSLVSGPPSDRAARISAG